MPLGYFTGSTPLTPLRDPFNVLVDAVNGVETTVSDTRQIQTFRWADATERAAQTGMVAGDIGYQIDTDAVYRYTGSAWRPAGSGLVPVRPASTAGGTISGTSVTFTTVGSVGVNGCFTSDFDNYLITIDISARSSVVDVNMKLRASGSDNSSSAYSGVKFYASGTSTTVTTPATGTGGWAIDAGGQSRAFATIEIRSPALSTPTIGWSDFVGGSAYVGKYNLSHSVSSAFDGFSLTPTSGTISGVIRVYGRV